MRDNRQRLHSGPIDHRPRFPRFFFGSVGKSHERLQTLSDEVEAVAIRCRLDWLNMIVAVDRLLCRFCPLYSQSIARQSMDRSKHYVHPNCADGKIDLRKITRFASSLRRKYYTFRPAVYSFASYARQAPRWGASIRPT